MTYRETIWRVTFGALGIFCFVLGALNVFNPWVALGYAALAAGMWFLALDDSIIDL